MAVSTCPDLPDLVYLPHKDAEFVYLMIERFIVMLKCVIALNESSNQFVLLLWRVDEVLLLGEGARVRSSKSLSCSKLLI